jgi:murein DD-endopeptidase MepM/ murein hydrolase activator NlpD
VTTAHATINPVRRRCCAGVGLLLAVASFAAWGAAYRYRDANGQWVYTDRPPADGRSAQGLNLGVATASSPRITVVPRSLASGLVLVAVNECRCAVEFAARVTTDHGLRNARQVVAASSEAVLLDLASAASESTVRFEYGYVIGEPGVQHRPSQPYRAPFASAAQFLVSQAPPDAVTHGDESSRHAIDIAMPVGTAVHAAREGVVINVARSHFRSGLQAQNLNEANFVQILHEDGTYAIYAHLQLDTVRVRPGQQVARGERIANSGNTGFTTGPHLHFVVARNAGLLSESLPVTFAGPGGAGVTPRTGQMLRAY